jgi:hypothetical protein
LVLLAAAAVKAYELATEPVTAGGVLAVRPVLIAAVETEFLFGVWLVAALTLGVNRIVGMGYFLAMAGVSLSKGVSGEASCGCLGPLAVNPWYPFAFDILAVGMLYLCDAFPLATRACNEPHKRPSIVAAAGTATLVVVVGVTGVYFMGSYVPAVLTDEGRIEGRGRAVVADPVTWLGQRLPLRDYGVGERFYVGTWRLLFVREGCRRCDDAIARLSDAMTRFPGERAALIGVSGQIEPSFGRERFETATLTDRYRWYIDVPCTVRVQDGLVQSVRSD